MATLDTESVAKREQLSHYIGKFKEDKVPYLIDYPLTIQVHNKVRNASHGSHTWLVQQGVGDIGSESQNWHYIHVDHVLPKHGIAAPLSYHVFPSVGKAFCFLPLPIPTYLPVHINGQFVLSSSRRSLWSGEKGTIDDEKEQWNKKILKAITSSYAEFLVKARSYYIDCKGHADLHEKIARYYSIFPYYIQQDTQIKQASRCQKEIGES